MAAGRLQFAASLGLAVTWCLLAASVLPGCGLNKEYVRRGVVLDSLAARVTRVETAQTDQQNEHREFEADILTEIEAVRGDIDRLEARMVDLNERLSRIGRKLGVWREHVVAPDTGVSPDTVGQDSVAAEQDTASAAVDPDQLYNTAYLDFTRGKYAVAVAGLEQFLQMFPDSDMADNAQYWVGECYYSLGELNKAEEEFKQVLIRYPTGNKVPAAAYKLGLVYQAQGREDAARRQFQAVVDKYPGTTEAKLAQERLSQ